MEFFTCQVLCLIARWVEDPNSEAYKLHLARIPDYFWLAEDGLKIQVSITNYHLYGFVWKNCFS